MDLYMKCPSLLLSSLWSDPNVHISKCVLPSCTLLDVSLPQTALYTNSPFYRTNLRRSTCLVSHNTDTQWGCKGLPMLNELPPFHPNPQAAVYRMRYSNKNEVLVSWQGAHWLISLDGATIIMPCEGPNTISHEGQQRAKYDRVKKAGELFVDQHTRHGAQPLQALLTNRTLVGTYDGKGLKWIALVDHESEQACVAPRLAQCTMHSAGILMEQIEQVSKDQLERLRVQVVQSRASERMSSLIFLISQERCHSLYLLSSLQSLVFDTMQQQVATHKYQPLKSLYFPPAIHCLPYPIKYYEDILLTAFRVNTTDIEFDILVKVACYMIERKCDVEMVKDTLIANQSFLEDLKHVSLDNYGSLSCKTVIIYARIGIMGKTNLGPKLEQYFRAADLHFETVTEKSIPSIVSIVKQDIKTQQLEHYLLQHQVSWNDIRQLKEQLKKSDDTSYQVIALRKKENVKINQKVCSFGWDCILKAYYDIHQNKKKARLIVEKRLNLQHITHLLQNSQEKQIQPKNVQIFEVKEHINICVPENKIIAEMIKIIQKIMRGQKVEDNYCSLILRLEKIEQIKTQWQDEDVERLIIESYPMGSNVFFKAE